MTGYWNEVWMELLSKDFFIGGVYVETAALKYEDNAEIAYVQWLTLGYLCIYALETDSQLSANLNLKLSLETIYRILFVFRSWENSPVP